MDDYIPEGDVGVYGNVKIKKVLNIKGEFGTDGSKLDAELTILKGKRSNVTTKVVVSDDGVEIKIAPPKMINIAPLEVGGSMNDNGTFNVKAGVCVAKVACGGVYAKKVKVRALDKAIVNAHEAMIPRRTATGSYSSWLMQKLNGSGF